MPKSKPEEKIQVQQWIPPKLKDNPPDRSRLHMNLKELFGFIPELMYIDKVKGVHGRLIISAVLPEELAKRDEKIDKAIKKQKAAKKKGKK